MPTFSFGLSAASIDQVHDGLACLAKFSEDVLIVPSPNELRISSLNVSKTSHACLVLQATNFFENYHFADRKPAAPSVRAGQVPKAWACRLQNRALLSVFRRRPTGSREVEQNVESCDFELVSGSEDRLVVRLHCWPKVIKTFSYTYEPADAEIVAFDYKSAPNTWTLPSSTLKDVVGYFGPKTDHVDWSKTNNEIIFTSYTEKLQIGREIVRQPAHTSVKLNKEDFEQCIMEDGLHISIPVKDFRALVTHADTMKINVKAVYSEGKRPAQLTYGSGGLSAEFTLATRGTSSTVASASRPSTPARLTADRQLSQRPSGVPARPAQMTLQQTLAARQLRHADGEQAEPQLAAEVNAEPGMGDQAESRSIPSKRNAPPLSGNPSAATSLSSNLRENSMFFPAPEQEDDAWNPQDYDDEPQFVMWDNSATEEALAALPSRFREIRGKSSSLGKRKADFPLLSSTQKSNAVNARLTLH